MVSLSRDGGLQAYVLRSMSVEVVRGSSSRGGSSALRGLVRRLKLGKDAAFAVDGPRGPLGEVKPGVIFAAKWSGAPIVPVTTSVRYGLTISRAWDRYLLPVPFSRAVIVAAEPLVVAHDASREDLDRARAALEATLKALTNEADLLVGRRG